MIKKIAAFIATVFIFSTITAFAIEKRPITFIVDGETVSFNDLTGYPYISDSGRTMMPLRTCLASIGGIVDWDQETQTVTIQKSNTKVEVPVGKTNIIINGLSVSIDSAAVIASGRTYLPLRAVLEAFGYTAHWDQTTQTLTATELTPYNINGGTTGIFQRRQLAFSGWNGIEADITLPRAPFIEKGDCPYIYFGFDFPADAGNVEGGFHLIVDETSPDYDRWAVFMRQGSDWRWGKDTFIQGATHHLKFYIERISDTRTDLVIEVDGSEALRKTSLVNDFSESSAKAVIAMAMNKGFDGSNCLSQSLGAKITNLNVSAIPKSDFNIEGNHSADYNLYSYRDFMEYAVYSLWRPEVGRNGMWYGTVTCVPACLSFEDDGSVSIY